MNPAYRYAGYVTGSLAALQRLYLRVFGIPEIGFQVRGLYFRRAMRRVRKCQLARILDAGSGIGAYAVWIAQSYPAATVVGCDMDGAKVSLGRMLSSELRLSNLHFVSCDVTGLPCEQAPFDLIVSIDVLEHVDRYRSALASFYRSLEPGGFLYLHVPQPNQRRILKRLMTWHHDDHVREGFAPEELIGELTREGFVTLEVRQTFGFLGKLAWELNHLSLSKNLVVAGLAFPFVYALARPELFVPVKHGLCAAILAQKTQGIRSQVREV